LISLSIIFFHNAALDVLVSSSLRPPRWCKTQDHENAQVPKALPPLLWPCESCYFVSFEGKDFELTPLQALTLINPQIFSRAYTPTPPARPPVPPTPSKSHPPQPPSLQPLEKRVFFSFPNIGVFPRRASHHADRLFPSSEAEPAFAATSHSPRPSFFCTPSLNTSLMPDLEPVMGHLAHPLPLGISHSESKTLDVRKYISLFFSVSSSSRSFCAVYCGARLLSALFPRRILICDEMSFALALSPCDFRPLHDFA